MFFYYCDALDLLESHLLINSTPKSSKKISITDVTTSVIIKLMYGNVKCLLPCISSSDELTVIKSIIIMSYNVGVYYYNFISGSSLIIA